MAGLRFDGVDDLVYFESIATDLADVPTGAYTVAILHNVDQLPWMGLAYLAGGTRNFGEVSLAGLGIQGSSGGDLVVDVGSGPDGGITTRPGVGTPQISVATKGAGTVAPRFHKKTAAGSWAHEVGSSALANQSAATWMKIGSWPGGSDFYDGTMGLIAFWVGAMSDAQVEDLADNWQTSDWFGHAFGTPVCLIECNVAAASLADIIANATALTIEGAPSLDGAEDFDSWNFDGTGGGGGTPQLLAASIIGTSSIASSLRVGKPLAASIAGSSSVAANLRDSKPLAASIQGTSVIAADLHTASAKLLAAAIVGQSAISASLATPKRLAATVTGTSSVSGALRASKLLAASISGTSTVTASLRATKTLAATITGSSAVTAAVRVGKPLAASIASTSSIVARLTVSAGAAATGRVYQSLQMIRTRIGW